ncbi:unnamed protein product [Lactuca virosa]|uniref:Uncharacterized protein n=1 Tax=Lactuca virosa TaxID=75947 RepID=A0AAU9NFR3_9ASTR|nr:unnamed protein product [Lactuca virosa]
MLNKRFDALKKCWHILKYLTFFVKEKKMSEVIYTCIISYNMILEDERNIICKYHENEIVPPTQAFEVSDMYMARRGIVHNVEIHHDLRRDLKEHVWTVDHIDFNAEPVDDLEDQFSDEDVH